jgi:hypothetical protein
VELLKEFMRRDEIIKARQAGEIKAQRDALLSEKEAEKKAKEAQDEIDKVTDMAFKPHDTVKRMRKHEF